MNVRERLLSTGEYHCQECGVQLGKDDDVDPVPAYVHKSCVVVKKGGVVVEIQHPLTPDPPKRMSKEEREEFKRWKAERKEDGDDHGQDGC